MQIGKQEKVALSHVCTLHFSRQALEKQRCGMQVYTESVEMHAYLTIIIILGFMKSIAGSVQDSGMLARTED